MKLAALWDFHDLEATRSRFTERLAAARSSGDLDAVACVLTQIARIDGLQGSTEDAHAKLNEAARLATSQSGEAAVRIALETGRLARDEGNAKEAARLFQHAIDRAKNLQLNELAVDALHMLAIVAPPERALELANEAQSLVEAGGEELRGWLGPILNNAGWSLFDSGRYDEAVSCFKRDAALRNTIGATAERQIADWNAAFTLRAAGKLDEAEQIQHDLESEIGAQGDGVAYVFEELAELADAKGEVDKAAAYAQKALQAHGAAGIDKDVNAEKLDRLNTLVKAASTTS